MSHFAGIAWRRILLLTALAGVVVWSIRISRTPQDAGEMVIAVHRRPERAPVPRAPTVQTPTWSEPTPRLHLAMQRNLFPQQSWEAPAGVAAAVPTPPPQAPPLPFTYVGRWQTDGKTTYYLAAGHQVYSAQLGQVLDQDWLLSAAQGQELDFVYGPLQQTRTLRMGDPLAQNPPLVRSAPAGH
ncbi:MAG: hypothetical protein KGL63_10960 [Betaproteobacteria bacterium]|nr:hypothetical protein [Betaproteobacteria bacterium]